MSNSEYITRDLSVVWHPCTQMKDHEWLPPVPVRRGEGVWLEDFDGNRYLDAISSWWVNLFGHCNPCLLYTSDAADDNRVVWWGGGGGGV